jgi:hypothetical protein
LGTMTSSHIAISLSDGSGGGGVAILPVHVVMSLKI